MITDLLNRLKLGKKRIFFIALAGLFILYLDFALLIRLQFRYIKNISPKIVSLKKDLGNLAKDLATMKDLQSKQTQIKQAGALSVKKIISEGQIPLLLQHISDIANKNHISIIQITPSKEFKAKEEKIADNTTKFAPILITLNLSCSYHNLGKFINDLDNVEGFITVEEMKIIRNPGNYLHQNINLALRAYVKK